MNIKISILTQENKMGWIENLSDQQEKENDVEY